MDLILFLDYFGTFVFAISGVLAAVERKFDLFGAITLGIVTAIGGGTLRDLMIGSTPAGWMTDIIYSLTIFAAIPICYLFSRYIKQWRKGLFLFDTIGIGLFTILGLQKTLAVGLSPLVAVMMGIVTAVFGGIIRDVLSNQVPLIFRKEIYASACLSGALVFLIAESILSEDLAILLAVCTVILIRILAIRRHWSLPFHPLGSNLRHRD